METKIRIKKYLRTFLNIAAGAGAVIGGTYIFSRLKEKQNTETRLERMEQILEEILTADESKKEKD